MGEEEAKVRDKLKDVDTEMTKSGRLCLYLCKAVFVNCVPLGWRKNGGRRRRGLSGWRMNPRFLLSSNRRTIVTRPILTTLSVQEQIAPNADVGNLPESTFLIRYIGRCQ